MAIFDFKGKLLEQGRRVITGVSENIIIHRLENSSDNPYGTLVVSENDDDINVLSMDLHLPEGPQGPAGPPPKLYFSIGSYVQTGYDPSVEVTERNTGEYNVILHLTRPQKGDTGATGAQGPQGEPGYSPLVTIDRSIDMLDPDDEEGWVEDLDPGKDLRLKFHIPRGSKGDPGEPGEPFSIQHIYASESAMNSDNTLGNIHPGEYAVIKSNPENEENSRLYYKEFNGNLTFIGDFSGAKGAHAEALAGTVTKLQSNQNPTVSLNGGAPVYDSNTDTYKSTFNFGIPAGANAKITSITANTLNSNQNVTATTTSVYDSNTDTNNTSITVGIPKGASSKITSVTAATLTPGSLATVTSTTTYVSSTDTYDSTLSFGIPKGDKGDPPTLTIGTVTTASTTPTASITTGTNTDYVLNLGLPRGERGETGQPGGAATINYIGQGDYNTIINIENVPGENQLDITYGGISANDIISDTIPVNHGGTGLDILPSNSLLRSNGTTVVEGISIGTGVLLGSQTTPSGVTAAFVPSLPITTGGTGATTSAAARTNLDVYSKSEVDTAINNEKITVTVSNGVISLV